MCKLTFATVIFAMLVVSAAGHADTIVLGKDIATLVNILATNAESQTGYGAWQANGSTKAELYVTPDGLFGRSVNIGELAKITYYTKKGGPQGDPDWYINIYTMPYTGGDSSWYGNRLTTEPLYSNNLNAPAGQWNQWSTDAGNNQLTFFDSNHTVYGFYGGPVLGDVTSGPVNWGDYPTSGSTDVIDYSTQEIKYIVLATGNTWANGFDGFVDAIRIELTDASWVLLDLENSFEVWVDDDFDNTTPGWGTTHFDSIQDAINAVTPGSIVNVADGTYNENLTINKPVTVRNSSSPVLDGGGSGNGIKITSSDVTVDGFEIRNYNIGILTDEPTGYQDVRILNNDIHDIGPGAGGFGVYIGYQAEAFHTPPVGTPLTDHLDFTGLEIKGNKIHDTTGACLVLQSIKGNPVLEVSDNNIYDGDMSAIWLDSSRDILFEDNVLEHCVDAMHISGYASGYYEDNPDEPFDPQNITAMGNIIQNNETGIAVWDGWPALMHFNNNSIVASSSYQGGAFKYWALSGADIDAEDNWWGKVNGPGPVGPGSGDRVYTHVDYDPWSGKPSHDNALYLLATDDSVYVQPSEQVIVDMNVANLLQKVNGCQAMLGYSSTYFSVNSVAEGGGPWDDLIYSVWTTPGEIDTAIGVRAQGNVGTDNDGRVAIITLTALTEGMTNVVFRPDADPDPYLIASTILADMNAQPVWPAKVNSTNIYIDGTDPEVTDLTATEDQGATPDVDVLNGANIAIQGTIEITVNASDALAGLEGTPDITLTHTDTVTTLTPVVADNVGPVFGWEVAIDSLTKNGRYDIEIIATDRAGNETTITGYIIVNKNQITGTVQFAAWDDEIGYGGYSFWRDVTFVATDGPGVANKLGEWTVPIEFTVPDHWGLASADYTLTDIPDGVTHVSAKTAWHLRKKITATDTGNGQLTADFIHSGGTRLRGGDLNNTNSVNILDYSILANAYAGPYDPAADITGDGVIGWGDFGETGSNWFQVGDEE